MGRKKHNKQSRPNQGQMMSNTTARGLTQIKEVPGLMTCSFQHQVSSTTADFKWTGPKISRAVWHQVLAFFKWTYDTSKSESQVRLYVNTRTQQWAAWAYPQEANTGMSAREMETPEAAQQRQQFAPHDGWIYFGTVHHHCAAGAFQSGTDENNERSQDGVHITVGHMDRDHYDIHERFYLSGYKLTSFNIADLWDIQTDYTAAFQAIPEILRPQIPPDAQARVARHEMGVPPPSGFEFPEQWRANVIVKVVPVTVPTTHHPMTTTTARWDREYTEMAASDLEWDFNRALNRVRDYVANSDDEALNMEAALGMIQELGQVLDDHQLNLLAILSKCDVLPDNFITRHEKKAMEDIELEKRKALNGGATSPHHSLTQEEIDEIWTRGQW